MLATLGIIQSNAKFTGLLDTYSGAAAAYSLRKLRNAYSGSAIRVRRSSDNTEQDIGFDGSGNLDETSLLSHTGYQNLFKYSEDFSNAVWNKNSNTVITATNITSPIGSSNATTIAYTNNGTLQYFNSSGYISWNSANIGVVSIYAKKSATGGANYIRISTNNTTAWNNGISIKVALTTSWQRIILSGTLISSGSLLNVHIGTNDASGTSDPDCFGNIDVWGAQVNTVAIQPYQVTTASARDGMGYVTKWYDQSGNARDAAQATSANQPRIVNAGTVDKSSNKPTIYFGGSTYFQVTDYDYVNYASLSVFSMNMPNSSSGGHLINHGDYNASNFSFNIAYYTGIRGYASSNGTITSSTFNILTTNNSFSTSSPHILSYIFLGSNSASNKQLFYYNSNSWATTLNGTYNANISSIYNSSKNIDIGVENRGGFGNYYFGRISELVLYNSDQSSNRTSIESNINSYYLIY